MKFNIKDINYIGIIIALLIALFALNNQYKNDSYTRVMNCFKDVIDEPDFCQKFYKQYKD
jgi:mannitol/fructose-specific phosphotransferase system IIA component (Ntr-type)